MWSILFSAFVSIKLSKKVPPTRDTLINNQNVQGQLKLSIATEMVRKCAKCKFFDWQREEEKFLKCF